MQSEATDTLIRGNQPVGNGLEAGKCNRGVLWFRSQRWKWPMSQKKLGSINLWLRGTEYRGGSKRQSDLRKANNMMHKTDAPAGADPV